MLPEMTPQERVFSSGFTSSTSSDFHASVSGKPSLKPLSSELDAPPLAARTFQSSPLAEMPVTLRADNQGERKRPDTVCTVYDPEDAYGGI
jgi:hypothetical protein